jgi:hypothetical protein
MTMIENSPDRPVTERRGYFARFFGFARGAGGEFNNVRSRSSARRSASSLGNRSSDSASRLLGVRRFGLGGFAFIGMTAL